MKTAWAVFKTRGLYLVSLAAGWMVLGYSDKLTGGWKNIVLAGGAALFIWGWLGVSPCAQGRCDSK